VLGALAWQRLLSGSVDGSSGHETVGGALRALLQAARAQLDRQVEVRMRQAAVRTSSRQPTGGGSPAAVAARSAMFERRVAGA
jgi:hypothetical protein